MALFLRFSQLYLPLIPVSFDLSIVAIFDELTNYIVDFETRMKRFVSQNDLLGAPEVAYEASRFKNEVLIKAGLAVRVPAQSSDALLHQVEAERANELIE